MNKLLRSLLFAVSLALVALPGLGRAAADEFVSLQVPDVTQAIGFFHAVMNCDVISRGAVADASSAAMLDCGDGKTVELTRRNPHAKVSGNPMHEQDVAFVTDNAIAAAAWLRANHVVMIGQPVRIAEGMDGEKVIVNFVAPWGQPMQLVSHGRPDDMSAGARLAVQ